MTNPRLARRPDDRKWTYTWTREELLAAGIAERYIPKGVQRATVIVEFRDSRYTISAAGKVRIRGRYTVEGDLISVVHTPPAPGYAPGQVYRQRWSMDCSGSSATRPVTPTSLSSSSRSLGFARQSLWFRPQQW